MITICKLKCQECDNQFENFNHPYQKYCSRHCQGKAYSRTYQHSLETRQKMSKGALIIKICRWCGKFFQSYQSEKRIFCGNKCRIAYFKLYPNRPWLGKKRPEVKKFLTMKGHHHTEEWKKQRSKQYKGRRMNEEQKVQISKTLMGHPANPGSGRGKSGWRKDIGHYCRSTWEANIARTLIYDKVNYYYEPKRFYFNGFTYLPDFYIPELDWWIEVKGYLDETAKKKINAFKSLGLNLFIISKEEYQNFKEQYKDKILWE